MDDAFGNIREFGKWIFTLFLDSVFMVAWLVLQNAVDAAVRWWEPTGMNVMFFYTFQVVFGLSTLAIVVMYTYRDIRIMWERTQRRIDKARQERIS